MVAWGLFGMLALLGDVTLGVYDESDRGCRNDDLRTEDAGVTRVVTFTLLRGRACTSLLANAVRRLLLA